MSLNFAKLSSKWRFYAPTAILAIASLASVSFFWRNPAVLTVTMLAFSIGMLSLHFSKRQLLFFALVSAAGTLAEVVGIYCGAWVYLVSPTPYVPPWLPLLWGIAGTFMLRVREAIDDVFS